jgi:acetyl/propionyl-CoA carboxylase alpha subunit
MLFNFSHSRVNDSVLPQVFYDPMIAKLVVHGEDRADALRRLRAALDEFEIVGPKTNIPFLKTLAAHSAFGAGDVETGFINVGRSFGDGLTGHAG